jgi:hypothetical protein
MQQNSVTLKCMRLSRWLATRSIEPCCAEIIRIRFGERAELCCNVRSRHCDRCAERRIGCRCSGVFALTEERKRCLRIAGSALQRSQIDSHCNCVGGCSTPFVNTKCAPEGSLSAPVVATANQELPQIMKNESAFSFASGFAIDRECLSIQGIRPRVFTEGARDSGKIVEVQRHQRFSAVPPVDGQRSVERSRCCGKIAFLLRNQTEVVFIGCYSTRVSTPKANGRCFAIKSGSCRKVSSALRDAGSDARGVSAGSCILDSVSERLRSRDVDCRTVELAGAEEPGAN